MLDVCEAIVWISSSSSSGQTLAPDQHDHCQRSTNFHPLALALLSRDLLPGTVMSLLSCEHQISSFRTPFLFPLPHAQAIRRIRENIMTAQKIINNTQLETGTVILIHAPADFLPEGRDAFSRLLACSFHGMILDEDLLYLYPRILWNKLLQLYFSCPWISEET